jgi:hypothetical protein
MHVRPGVEGFQVFGNALSDHFSDWLNFFQNILLLGSLSYLFVNLDKLVVTLRLRWWSNVYELFSNGCGRWRFRLRQILLNPGQVKQKILRFVQQRTILVWIIYDLNHWPVGHGIILVHRELSEMMRVCFALVVHALGHKILLLLRVFDRTIIFIDIVNGGKWLL